MRPGKVRAIAICVFRRESNIFVFEGHDSIKGETFYRPLGGTIEFGEHSAQTVIREISEEIGVEIANLRYLATLESIFVHEGKHGHEIVLVYEADFTEPSMYDREEVIGYEDDGKRFKALWVPLDDFANGRHPLYPSGLLALLQAD